MLIRPQDELVAALAAAGVDVESDDGHLPITVSGHGKLPRRIDSRRPSRSSQFVTALLLVAPLAERASGIGSHRPGGEPSVPDFDNGGDDGFRCRG